MPPPSSGGVNLIEMLNILEGYDLGKYGAGSVDALHLMIETMKRAYADRAVFLGDPDKVHVPEQGLIAKSYAAKLRAQIDLAHARPSADIHPGEPPPAPEGHNTTHFSVIDKDGNAVSNTYTLNFSFGLGLVADGTGVLLNNELDDFAAKPMAPNAYGLVGFAANAPGPDKRPLSSMTPTIVLKDSKPVFPRVHHQWLPDIVYVEPGFSSDLIRGHEARGHTIRPTAPYTSANSIAVTPGGFVGAADARSNGSLAAGY
jgi:gamma-glutamyltranspeptidase/glutathione hydrolase